MGGASGSIDTPGKGRISGDTRLPGYTITAFYTSQSGEDMRRGFKIVTAVAAMSTLGLTPALGAVVQRTQASDTSPFGPNCNTQPQSGALYLNSEVEPWLDVDPTSANDEDGPDFIGVYQQDRKSVV